jgi:hypothetical protein
MVQGGLGAQARPWRPPDRAVGRHRRRRGARAPRSSRSSMRCRGRDAARAGVALRDVRAGSPQPVPRRGRAQRGPVVAQPLLRRLRALRTGVDRQGPDRPVAAGPQRQAPGFGSIALRSPEAPAGTRAVMLPYDLVRTAVRSRRGPADERRRLRVRSCGPPRLFSSAGRRLGRCSASCSPAELGRSPMRARGADRANPARRGAGMVSRSTSP